MKYAVLFSVLALTSVAAQPVLAGDGFQCPAKPLEAPRDARVQAALPSGDGLDKVEALNTAVATLRGEGVNPILIIDGLIAAYCPTVAALPQLTDAQKNMRVTRFAARVTRTVYALDSADMVILDVSLPPAVVDSINAKASAAGISSEDWIRGAVDKALQ